VKRRLIILSAVVYLAVTLFVSLFLFRPATPIIDIKGEPILHIADLGNEMLDVNLTNTVFTAWVVMALLFTFMIVAVRKRSMVPTGLYNFVEAIIELVLSFVISVAGERNGRRFFPLVASLLIYIAFANWLSLTPLFNAIGVFEPIHAEEAHFHERAVVFKEGSVSWILPGADDYELDGAECELIAAVEEADACREHVIEAALAEKELGEGEQIGILAPYLRGINTDLMTPLAFALMATLFVEYWGVSSLGFFTYLGKFFNFHGPIDFIVGLLELVAEVGRIISFSFRLFGNMLAGEILLLMMTFLVPLVSPVLLVFYGLELFVGLIQAVVFGALTLIFATMAVSHHGSDSHGEEEHH
jgi:F-type H+-transporting ATPase subunit a